MSEFTELRFKNGSVIRFKKNVEENLEVFQGVLDTETVQNILQAEYEMWLQEEQPNP